MAELRTPVVSSGDANVHIEHPEGDTVITVTQQVRIQGYLSNSDVWRVMAGTEKTVVTRFSKAAIKALPAAAPMVLPDPDKPMYTNGDLTYST